MTRSKLCWWDEKKNPHCPYCQSNSRKKGSRRGKVKYQCQACLRWFQVNRSVKLDKGKLLKLHLDGLSFRSLADQFNLSVGSVYNYCLEELVKLPHCADVTRAYCQKYPGILLVDGKFVKVKHFERKIPVLYGIDYFTHDIPTFTLSKAENYQTCSKFFTSLKLLDYPLQALVCDDNINIYQAGQRIYPASTVQLCLNHFKEGLRAQLQVRTEETYQPFMRELETLFAQKRSQVDFDQRARRILLKYQHSSLCTNILLDIERRKPLLMGYLGQRKTPTTTNLIESFNSHLNGRLKTIKGFESFKHASLWLNAYFLRRRTKKFTDCSGKFKNLNGKTSLQMAQKPGIELPRLF